MISSVYRGGGIAVLAAIAVLAGCSGRPVGDDAGSRPAPSTPTSRETPSAPVPTEHRRIAVDAEPDTRAAAQRVLERAERRMLRIGEGSHALDFEIAGLLTFSSRTRYAIADNRSETVSTSDLPGSEDDLTATRRLVDGHVYTRPTIRGRTMPCWLHLVRPDLAAAGASATTPPLSMLLEPQAKGFLVGYGEDASYREVVVDVLLAEAVGAALPRLLDRIDPAPLAGRTVPAVVTVADGAYLSLEFELGDAVDQLAEAGVDLDDLARQAGLAQDPDGSGTPSGLLDALVGIDYAFVGGASDVTAPDGRVVDVDTSNPDAPIPVGCRL